MGRINHNKEALNEILERWESVDIASMSDSEIEEMIEDIYRAKSNINLPIPFKSETVAKLFKMFHCQGCGECCVGGGDGVFLNPEDIERLSTGMQISKRRFKDKFTFVTEGKRLLHFPCPFYDSNSHSCIVYQLRPSVCQLFPFLQSEKTMIAKRPYPSTNGERIVTVSTLCPEGRRIACQFIKIESDFLASSKKLDKSNYKGEEVK